MRGIRTGPQSFAYRPKVTLLKKPHQDGCAIFGCQRTDGFIQAGRNVIQTAGSIVLERVLLDCLSFSLWAAALCRRQGSRYVAGGLVQPPA
jgi:hypothetical protein